MAQMYGFSADARGSIKSIPISAMTPEMWTSVTGDSGSSSSDFENIITYYKRVTWLYRAVEMRALAVASMPHVFVDARGDEHDELPSLNYKLSLSRLLNEIEGHLVLYGAAYVYPVRNRGSAIRGLRTFHPSTITVEYDNEDGVKGYKRSVGGSVTLYSPKDVIAIWLPNRESELGEGQPPAKAALSALATHKQSADFVNAFFKQSPIAPTLMTVEGTPPPAEIEKIESWAKRMFGGLRNAFRTLVMRAGLNVHQLDIIDVSKVGIDATRNAAKEEIAVALGIPFPLLWSNAANYATAMMDEFNFYDKTIVPNCELIAEALNDAGVFGDYVLEFREDRLPSYQAMEAQRAQDKLLPLVQAGIIRRSTAARELGYEEDADWADEEDMMPAPAPPAPPVDAQAEPQEAVEEEEADARAVRSVSISASCKTHEHVPAEHSERLALRKWQTMAKKRYRENRPLKALEFTDSALSEFVRTYVASGLAAAESWEAASSVFAGALQWAGTDYP